MVQRIGRFDLDLVGSPFEVPCNIPTIAFRSITAKDSFELLVNLMPYLSLLLGSWPFREYKRWLEPYDSILGDEELQFVLARMKLFT
jgi:hypothetical protein